MSNSSKINRRNFFAAGLASAVVAAKGSAIASPQQRVMGSPKDKSLKDLPYNPRTHKMMPTRNLGNTGYQVGI